MLADCSYESLPCVAAISSWEPLAHVVHLASLPPAHWKDKYVATLHTCQHSLEQYFYQVCSATLHSYNTEVN